MPSHEGYTPWCPDCEWNLFPVSPEPKSLYERVYLKLGERQGEALFESIKSQAATRPRLSPATLLALVLSAFIHCLTPISAGLGVFLLWQYSPNLIAILLGIVFIVMAWLVRPRLNRRPANLVTRDLNRLPAMFGLADSISDGLGAPRIDGFVIDAAFNASIWHYGLRRKVVITIGLPLFHLLERNEKMALLAHEIGHRVNGDISRGLMVGTAIDALILWHEVLYADYIWEPDSGLEGLFAAPFNVAMRLVSIIPWTAAFLLVHLLWRDSQKAEYYADAIAAKVAGRDPLLGLLRKLLFANCFRLSVQRTALNGGDLFAEQQSETEKLPQSERDRLLHLEMTNLRLDATHPPLSHLMMMLNAYATDGPQAVLSEADDARISSELADWRERIQRQAIDQYRETIYQD